MLDTSKFRLNVERESDMKNWVWIATDDPVKIGNDYKVTYSTDGKWFVDDLWPWTDGNYKTHLPWDWETIGKDNTVYEAWTSGAVRSGDVYYNPSAGELARLLGDR